jgi:hypothetical protein
VWSQNEKEIEMIVDIPHTYTTTPLTKKDITCIYKTDKLCVNIKGELFLEGSFYALVDPDECNWQIGNFNFN